MPIDNTAKWLTEWRRLPGIASGTATPPASSIMSIPARSPPAVSPGRSPPSTRRSPPAESDRASSPSSTRRPWPARSPSSCHPRLLHCRRTKGAAPVPARWRRAAPGFDGLLPGGSSVSGSYRSTGAWGAGGAAQPGRKLPPHEESVAGSEGQGRWTQEAGLSGRQGDHGARLRPWPGARLTAASFAQGLAPPPDVPARRRAARKPAAPDPATPSS